MSDPVTRLPLEILDEIVRHLRDMDDERSAALVSKRWYSVAKRYVYECVDLDHEDSTILFFETIHLHNPSLELHVQKLYISTGTVAPITLRRLLHRSWPKLEILVVPATGHDILQSVEGMSVFPQLLELRLESSEFYTKKRLSLPDHPNSTLEPIPPRFPKLQTLHLGCMPSVDPEPVGLLSFFRAASPGITSLTVHRGKPAANRGGTELLDLLQHVAEHLQSLELCDRHQTFDLPTLACIQELPKLKSLDLTIEGHFVYPLVFPATLQQLYVKAHTVQAEHLRTFWSDIRHGRALQHLEHAPMITFAQLTGDPGSVERCMEEWQEANRVLRAKSASSTRH